jgi:hypothetical protein
MINRDIYTFMEWAAPFLIFWSFAFTLITGVRIMLRVREGIARVPDSMVFTELAGLPLTLLQPVCFVWAMLSADMLSALLFLWWGPGFIAIAVAVIATKARGKTIDWHPWRRPISYLCKLYYLAYAATFIALGMPGMLFAFSVWIINDQYEKAVLSLDADRLRRTFDDHWLFRILYPAGLLIPYVAPAMANRTFSAVYGTGLLILWLAGILYVRRAGSLFTRPADATLLRNMMYFAPRDRSAR